ncbi:RNA methyltransferase [Flavobacteriaceae bacterium]|nr:RNA methyltransferase [Flavobacteriaceae bacterium]MDB2427405.1 RNA methyltransferase [Flavobacteriaceae bacterium]MDB2684395.1 RNA methyltransferase [Flavobacteriaceae bacterium]
MKQIQSLQNPLIKNILKLQEKSRERKKQQLFVIEGKREIELAFKGQFEIDSLLFIPHKIENDYLKQYNAKEVIEITPEVYKKIAYRESTEGIIAIAKSKYIDLNSLNFKNIKPLILVVEGIEKPGNIGAMIRSADAANIDAVILADPKTDQYNPNVIRSSVGGVFTKNIVISSSEEIIAFFKKNNIKMYAATLQNSNLYTNQNYTEASAIIVGTEANGLTQIWRDHSTKNINIPMQGEIDSMNVSVAAAVILFEAKRQRNFK